MSTINDGFIAAFRKYAQRVHELAAPLDETQFRTRPYPYGNSFCHLVLHLTGNLNYYIGAQMGETGYIRHRDLEFTDPHPPAKAEVLARFDAAINMVIATVETQTDADWALAYEAVGAGGCRNRLEITMQCAAHLYHHIGQMIYLQREWTK
ncbi:MAG: DinB family protein [Blastocatellia bacterium]